MRRMTVDHPPLPEKPTAWANEPKPPRLTPEADDDRLDDGESPYVLELERE
jgi:hypothetical protein